MNMEMTKKPTPSPPRKNQTLIQAKKGGDCISTAEQIISPQKTSNPRYSLSLAMFVLLEDSCHGTENAIECVLFDYA